MRDDLRAEPCQPAVEDVGKYLLVPSKVLLVADPDRLLADLQPPMLEAALASDPTRVGDLLRRGAEQLGDERLYATFMGLVGPVVRQLEQLWQTDAVPFAQLLGAFWAIQTASRSAGTPAAAPRAPGRAGRIHVATLDRAQHTFGALAVARLLSDAGWDVTLNISGVTRFSFAELHRQPHDAIALSVGNDIELGLVNGFVAEARKAGAGRELCVVVGGNVFAHHAEGFGFLDVDLVARHAGEMLDHLVQRVQPQSAREGSE